MEEYIKKIEQIAARCTESQSDGYSQIMKICDAMREEQIYCLGYVSKGETYDIEERGYENGLKSAIQKMLLKTCQKKKLNIILMLLTGRLKKLKKNFA